MQDITDRDRVRANRVRTESRIETSDPALQAFRILHFGFVVLPTVAGLDKFFHMLVNWNVYLAPQIARLSPIPVRTLFMIAGVIEIAVGLLVALKPKIGGYVVGVWMLAIVAELAVAGYYDIALRDVGLALAAFALARLATAYDRNHVRGISRKTGHVTIG